MSDARTSQARRLRRGQTDGERRLWSRIRGRALGGFKFRRQTPIGRYVADFACVEAKLVVELDGGHHSERVDYDEARTQALEQAGFQVLRYWNHQVLLEIENVLDDILAHLTLTRR